MLETPSDTARIGRLGQICSTVAVIVSLDSPIIPCRQGRACEVETREERSWLREFPGPENGVGIIRHFDIFMQQLSCAATQGASSHQVISSFGLGGSGAGSGSGMLQRQR